MLFDKISPPADFSSKITINKLDILIKNVLYCTHELDKIKKLVIKLSLDKDLQTQVDKYFEDDETSPQTESDEQV